MGVYEGLTGDKDARDAADMRNSAQLRKYGDVEEAVGDFEKHTKVMFYLLLLLGYCRGVRKGRSIE